MPTADKRSEVYETPMPPETEYGSVLEIMDTEEADRRLAKIIDEWPIRPRSTLLHEIEE